MSDDPEPINIGPDDVDRAIERIERNWIRASLGRPLPPEFTLVMAHARAQLARDLAEGDRRHTVKRRIELAMMVPLLVINPTPAVVVLWHLRGPWWAICLAGCGIGWLFGGIGSRLYFATVSKWWWSR